MATRSSHNKNNSAIKRIMQEARELANDPSTDYSATPLEEDIFEWHCTLRGPPGTEFEGGLYHFRIILPAEYPFRPPSIMMLTPSGRFELNTKICISFTNYHEELWQPAWGVRTAIIGLQGFFPLKGQAAVGVGSLEAPASERRRLAKLSRNWICPHCSVSNLESLPDPPSSSDSHTVGVTQENDNEHAQVMGDPSQIVNSSPAGAGSENTSVASEPRPVLAPTITETATGHTASSSLMNKHPESSDISELIRRVAPDEGAPTTAGSHPGVRPAQHALSRGLEPPSPTETRTYVGTTTVTRTSTQPQPRPPVLLDVAIGVLLLLVAALLCRKIY